MKSQPKHANNILVQGLPERRYLPELHGVRGLALLGVVLFHLFGSGRVSGGIDIFLAVSGFLFTGMLLREATTTSGSIDLYKYFGRLIRRIVAPAAIVAITTLIVGLAISPVTQHRQLWAEARASLLYFENFELINSQLAYGAAGPDTSIFQHFWSLSVQGSFILFGRLSQSSQLSLPSLYGYPQHVLWVYSQARSSWDHSSMPSESALMIKMQRIY